MHQVRYFPTLCQELNFTRAAEKCNVAQPALTRAVKLLEDELGGPLFHRERARTHLSELGQAVRPYLEEVLRQSQQAKRLATNFIELKGTPLKLGVMCTIGPNNFVALLANLQTQHPGIELQIMDAGASELQERIGGRHLLLARPDRRAAALSPALPGAILHRARSAAPPRQPTRDPRRRSQRRALPQPYQLRASEPCTRHFRAPRHEG